ncbi:amino acid ABC transporter permease [Clostridium diolis]|uniref:Amino acid ABC transporter permease n=1 Tax=Clostridium diolis TaxID=223919 RepID=A0AAV3W5D7_9CLOT|nr:amino acid ABC transporter permease [Clostridium diolis]QES73384.1 amino acid ABC transporter permease [Clostridium diolis]GEA33715.1 amino acid ABC transporter permease [Clostridium diolis]
MNFDVNFALENFWQAVAGIPNTLLVTFVAFMIGFPIAFFIAQVRIKNLPVLSQIAGIYISFVRGTPVVVQIFLVYNIALAYHFNPLYAAFFVFAVNCSATYSEMWKSSLSSVGKGQLEAAHSSGLTTFQAYIHIIIPQSLSVAFPSLCSSTLTMLKNTSLVFIMSVQDITAKAKIAAGLQYKYIEGYLDIFIVYLIVCIILQGIFNVLEKKLSAHKLIDEKKKNKLLGKGLTA